MRKVHCRPAEQVAHVAFGRERLEVRRTGIYVENDEVTWTLSWAVDARHT